MPRLCSIPDCGNVHEARGLCCKHYKRLQMHGDPMGTNKVAAGAPYEFYCDTVLTYEGDECIIWPFVRAKGYGRMRRKGGAKQITVSRAICEDVYGPAPTDGHDAAHSCGNGHLGCVTKRHLRWATRLENAADRTLHGTQVRGETHPSAKLTERQVIEIIALAGVEPPSAIASRFGVTATAVRSIHAGKTWSFLRQRHGATA